MRPGPTLSQGCSDKKGRERFCARTECLLFLTSEKRRLQAAGISEQEASVLLPIGVGALGFRSLQLQRKPFMQIDLISPSAAHLQGGALPGGGDSTFPLPLSEPG